MTKTIWEVIEEHSNKKTAEQLAAKLALEELGASF